MAIYDQVLLEEYDPFRKQLTGRLLRGTSVEVEAHVEGDGGRIQRTLLSVAAMSGDLEIENVRLGHRFLKLSVLDEASSTARSSTGHVESYQGGWLSLVGGVFDDEEL